jgi:hypothetical protein
MSRSNETENQNSYIIQPDNNYGTITTAQVREIPKDIPIQFNVRKEQINFWLSPDGSLMGLCHFREHDTAAERILDYLEQQGENIPFEELTARYRVMRMGFIRVGHAKVDKKDEFTHDQVDFFERITPPIELTLRNVAGKYLTPGFQQVLEKIDDEDIRTKVEFLQDKNPYTTCTLKLRDSQSWEDIFIPIFENIISAEDTINEYEEKSLGGLIRAFKYAPIPGFTYNIDGKEKQIYLVIHYQHQFNSQPVCTLHLDVLESIEVEYRIPNLDEGIDFDGYFD